MAYDAFEYSPDLGHPVRLFEFWFGSLRFYYTDSENSILYAGKTWFPVPIKHSPINDSASGDKQTVQFDMSAEAGFARQFLGTVAPWGVVVKLYYGHLDDPDQEFIQKFDGVMTQASFRKQMFSISFETRQNQPGAVTGLRQPFSTMCPHTLYDHNCKVDKALHTVTTIPTNVTGTILTLPQGWEGPHQKADFLYGLCEWDADDGGHVALIVRVDDANDQIHLAYSPTTIVASETQLTLSKGCPKTSAACENTFNNIINFGGSLTSPLNTPFGG